MVRQKGNWRIQIDKKSYKIDRLMIRWTYGKMDRTIKKYINQIDRKRKKSQLKGYFERMKNKIQNQKSFKWLNE